MKPLTLLASLLLAAAVCVAQTQTQTQEPGPPPLSLELPPLPPIDPSRPTLFLVGDSTVKVGTPGQVGWGEVVGDHFDLTRINVVNYARGGRSSRTFITEGLWNQRSEEHTSELQSQFHLVCRLLLEKKKKIN